MNVLAKTAAEAAKKAAQSKAAQKVVESAAVGLIGLVGKGGGTKYIQWRDARKQRELAYKLARQVHGQLSEAVFVGSDTTHLVVWKDDIPIAAFPALEGDLAERAELRHVAPTDRFKPPTRTKKMKKG